jgi:hypothetical protein
MLSLYIYINIYVNIYNTQHTLQEDYLPSLYAFLSPLPLLPLGGGGGEGWVGAEGGGVAAALVDGNVKFLEKINKQPHYFSA